MSILTATISIGKRPWVLSTLELFFDNLWIKAHFLKETVNHILPTMMFAVVTVAVSMSMTVVFSLVLVRVRVSWLCLFVKDGHHNCGCAICLLYLEEGMIVIKFFFAIRTVIEVLADSALVTNSDDRRLAATIAGNTNVSNNLLRNWLFGLFSLRNLETDAFVFQQLVENDARLFFKFLLHQSLQRLSR